MKSAVYFALLGALVLVGACKKEDPKPDNPGTPVESGKVYINMDNMWESASNDFVLGTMYTQSTSGDELTFYTLKYYVSNFKLKRSDGTWWSHPDSYFLVNEENPSSTILELSGAPLGTYTDIAFTFGVDSAKNVSGPQSGALSTANDMFWGWSSGYIMLKAEGTSPQGAGNVFSYHLGGFEGIYNIVKEMTYSFGATPLTVTKTGTPNIFMHVNISKMFDGLGSVSEGSTSSVGNISLSMGTAFHSGISFDHLEN